MQCDNCKFELPDDWLFSITPLCVPCQHLTEGIGTNRIGLMTPWERK